MTDVRLTATNPEDSSVVPVACNDKGELKLEEAYPFDGTLDGDLTVTGSGEFERAVQVNGSVAGDSCFITRLNNGSATSLITADGTAYFLGDDIEVSNTGSGPRFTITDDDQERQVYVGNSGTTGGLQAGVQIWDNVGNRTVTALYQDGSAEFARNKAGFTTDGYLWCTTRRGDTVILDATSNGLATWAAYTPPTRLNNKLESLRDESNTISQDLPET